MNRIFEYVAGSLAAIGVTTLIVTYLYLSAAGPPQITDTQVMSDRRYLSENQGQYADCYYTVNNDGLAVITLEYYNQVTDRSKVNSLESEFKSGFNETCEPILEEYAYRYEQYLVHKKEAAEAELSRLDKLIGREATTIDDSSPILSFYQRYDPKSLNYISNPGANRLYSEAEYREFLQANL